MIYQLLILTKLIPNLWNKELGRHDTPHWPSLFWSGPSIQVCTSFAMLVGWYNPPGFVKNQSSGGFCGASRYGNTSSCICLTPDAASLYCRSASWMDLKMFAVVCFCVPSATNLPVDNNWSRWFIWEFWKETGYQITFAHAFSMWQQCKVTKFRRLWISKHHRTVQTKSISRYWLPREITPSAYQLLTWAWMTWQV